MEGAGDLLSLLPEVQEVLSDNFDGVECSIGPGPVLSQSPFRMSFKYLGRQVIYVPDLSVSCLEDFDSTTFHRISLNKNSALFTDGQSGCCLELVLGSGKDWKSPLIKLFNRLYPGKWAFFVTELENGHASFHLLCSDYPPTSTRREDTPDSAEQSSQTSSPGESVSESSNFSLWIVPITQIFAIPPPKKVKVVKKVIKKKSPQTEANGTNGTNGTVTTVIGEDGKEKRVRIVKKLVKKDKTPDRDLVTPDSSSTPTKQKSSDSIVSVIENGTPETNGKDKILSNGHSTAGTSNSSIDEDVNMQELRNKLGKVETNGDTRRLNGGGLRPSLSRKSITPDKRLDPIYESIGRKERSISPAKTVQQEMIFRQALPNGRSNGKEMPFIVLQMILGNQFTYEELGKLRLVHPHWDEIAGQLLNSGYYKLLERSDNLLMTLQRKLPSDPSLLYPTTILTNIQVHILNPVDIMRAVLDEGVCCFPYGVILDRTFHLLDLIELLLKGDEVLQDAKIDWESVATLAKKAQLHYKMKLEKTMEDRLGENLRLKAAQRIIRLDSFMVESSVTKLEKDTAKARDDLKWEIEQLQQQNAQLRRDNRQLRQDQMKLDTRVEILEQKFKTLARLLS